MGNFTERKRFLQGGITRLDVWVSDYEGYCDYALDLIGLGYKFENTISAAGSKNALDTIALGGNSVVTLPHLEDNFGIPCLDLERIDIYIK